MNGIILCDVYPTGLEKSLEKLSDASIPAILIGDSRYDSTKYLCSVSVDAKISGSMAAEFMHHITKDEANIIIFVGNKNNAEHKAKIDSFSDVASSLNMNIIGVYETQDDEAIAERLVENLSENINSVDGIYIATSNSCSICKKLAANDYIPKIITTDINEKISMFLNNGIVQCTVYQNLERQGETAIRIMYEYLAEHKTSPKSINIAPILVMRSNAHIYLV